MRIYVTGIYNSDILIIGNDTLYQDGVFSIFLSKFDSACNPIWTKCIHGETNQKSKSIVIDNDGNICITGYYLSEELHLDTITLTNNTCPAYLTFLAKYNTNGQILWAKKSSNIQYGLSRSVAIDASNNIYISGDYNCPLISFDSIVLYNSDVTGIGSSDVFLVKYNPSGDVLWAKSINGGNSDFGRSIAVDKFDNIYQTGWFISSTITCGNIVLSRIGSFDIFICKYDNEGNVLWAKCYGGTGDDEIFSLRTDYLANIYLSGWYAGSDISFGTDTLSYTGVPSVFLTKFDDNGICLWAKNIGEKSYDGEVTIAVNPTGDVFLTGNFTKPYMNFGSIILANTDTSGSTNDIFIAKLNLTTQTQEIEKINLSIYPNPCSDHVSFESSVNALIEIIGPQGNLIKTFNLNRNKTMHVGYLPPGIYIIKATTNKVNTTYKLIKK